MEYISKLQYREYSLDPNKGIPIALDILNQPNPLFEDHMSAACYLGYRILDNTYKDKQYVYDHLEKCHDVINEKLKTDTDHITIGNRYRWLCSHTILLAYIKILKEKDTPIPEDILEKCFDKKITDHWPSQAVNVLRAGAILFHFNYKNKEKASKIKQKMIEIYHDVICVEKKNFIKLSGLGKIVENMSKVMHITNFPCDMSIIEEEINTPKNLDRYFYNVIRMIINDSKLEQNKNPVPLANIEYAIRPRIGIPLAKKMITEGSKYNPIENYISSTVYLGYRLLDGTYKNLEEHDKCMSTAFGYCESIDVKSVSGYRWILSLTLLKTYIDTIMKTPDILDNTLLEKTYSLGLLHQNQLSNYTKLGTLLYVINKDDKIRDYLLNKINSCDLDKLESMSRDVIADLLKPYLEANDVLKRNEVLKKYEGWYIYKDFIKTIYILEK